MMLLTASARMMADSSAGDGYEQKAVIERNVLAVGRMHRQITSPRRPGTIVY